MNTRVKLLNGKQLVENGCKHDQLLPTKGPKSSVYSGTRLEKKQIESALDDRKHALQHQRIEKIGSLTQAIWEEEVGKALVTEKRGTYWLHMGHTENHGTYIYPEEILHLLEMNALDLKYGGVRMSLQQAYSKFIGKYITLDEYRVYSNLSRQGYKLMRHNESTVYFEESDEEENTSKTSVNENPTLLKRTSEIEEHSKKNIKHVNVEPSDAENQCSSKNICIDEVSSDDCMMVTESPNTKRLNMDVNDVTTVIETDSDKSSHGTDVVCLPSLSLKTHILSNIPNCYKKRYISLKSPDSKYIPPNINLPKYHHTLALDKLVNAENPNRENVGNTGLISLRDSLQFLRYSALSNNNLFFNNIIQNFILHGNPVNNLRNNIIYGKPDFKNFVGHRFSRPPITPDHIPIREITNRNLEKDDSVESVSKGNKKRHEPITSDNNDKHTITKCDIQDVICEKDTSIKTSSEIIPQSSTTVVSKKQDILNKLELLMTKFSSMSNGNKSSEIKEALILAVIKFNDTFDERYTLVFKENNCSLKSMPKDEDEEGKQDTDILELSSDSDSPPYKLLKRLNERTKTCNTNTKRKRKLRTRRKRNVSVISCDASSSDESPSSCKTFSADSLAGKELRSQNNICIAKNSLAPDVIQKWYLKDSWNTPEIGKPKINKKTNYISNVGLKIASVILDNIKELSYKRDCPIESWSQGKELYKNKITSNVVCISDDDMTNDHENEAEFNEISCLAPLVRQEDCISVEAIMKRLQIVEPSCEQISATSTEDISFRISYDMYFPTDKNLRKTELPPPPFSLIIIRDTLRLPTPHELRQIRNRLHKDVALLLGIVSFDTIAYLQMENTTLPDMISRGDC